jgi:ribosomal protein S18 acetylase RimI-like enzyme
VGGLRIESSEEWGDAGLVRAREFVRARIFDRAPLHASLECPPIRKRSRLLRATDGDRLVGLAAIVDGTFPYRSVPLSTCAPNVARSLLCEVEAPFVALVPQPLWYSLLRCGGVQKLEEIQMARMWGGPLPEADPRLERLDGIEELQGFIGARFSPVHFETGPFLGIRDPEGRLIACGGTLFVTDRLAQMGYVATHPDRRGEGLARAIVGGLIRELERDERSLTLQVGVEHHEAIRLYSDLGFRGRIRTGLFLFNEPVRAAG